MRTLVTIDMDVAIVLLLAFGITVTHQTEGHLLTSDRALQNITGCDFPFQRLGSNCYYFSEEELNFNDAIDYCISLGHGHSYEVSLAMLDYDENENEAVLSEAVSMGKSFWVGGKTDDSVNWEWLDNRKINLYSQIWYFLEPNTAQNKCATAQVSSFGNNVRSYLYDYDCSDSLNFICQTGFQLEFKKIDKHYYLFSEEVGLPRASWQNARDYCRTLTAPIGYYSDLAVLGRSDQDTYYLMENLPGDYDSVYIWIGALAENDCNFKWIDGRSLNSSSHNWLYSQPTCSDNARVNLHKNIGDGYKRNVLVDDADYRIYPFICQLFKY